jgi:hypothetical protein
MQNMELSYDLSLDSLAFLGMTGLPARFYGSDILSITTYLVVNTLTSGYYEPKIKNQAYIIGVRPDAINRFEQPADFQNITTINDLTNHNSYWCENWGGQFSMVGYSRTFRFNNNSVYFPNRNDCSRQSIIYQKISFPEESNDYFPKEFRNFLLPDTLKLNVPDGYEILDTARIEVNNLLSRFGWVNVSQINTLVDVVNNKAGYIYFNPLFEWDNETLANGKVWPEDESGEYIAYYFFRPICNPTLADTNFHYNSATSTFTNYPLSKQDSIYDGYFRFRKFDAQLKADTIRYYAETKRFTIDNIIEVKNTVSPIVQSEVGDINFANYKNAENVFVLFRSKSDRFEADSLYILKPNNTDSIKVGYSNNEVYQLDDLFALGYRSTPNFKKIRIGGRYNCIDMPDSLFNRPDTVVMYFGWSCNGYPENLQSLYSSSCITYDSVYHIIVPRDVVMNIGLRASKSILLNCDTASFTISMQSTSQGYLYNVFSSVELNVPPSVKLCDNNVIVHFNNEDTTLEANFDELNGIYLFDISKITENGLNSNDSITITGCLQTTCTESDTANILLKTSSIAYCGDTIRQQREIQLYIQPYIPAEPDTLTVFCEPIILQQNQSLFTSVRIRNHRNTPSIGNILSITLPNDISIDSWDNSNNTYSMPIGVIDPVSDTLIFFTLNNSATCGTFSYNVQLNQVDSVVCSSDTCQRMYVAASCTDSITVKCDTITIINNDTTICEGNSITLWAVTNNPTDTIYWNVDGVNVANGNPFVFTPAGVGTYEVITYLENSFTPDTVYITVIPQCQCNLQFDAIWGSNVGIDTIWANDPFILANANVSKNVLISGFLMFKNFNSDTTISLRRWNFKMLNGDEVADIYLDSIAFQCLGCSFTPLCDEMWGGIVLGEGSGIVLNRITGPVKESVIEEMKWGIRHEVVYVKYFPGNFNRVFIANTRFINCERGISLRNFPRRFVASGTSRDAFEFNTFTHANKNYFFEGNSVIIKPIPISLAASDFYNLKIKGNKIDNAFIGIQTQSVYAHILQNTITNTQNAITSLGSYSTIIREPYRSWDVIITNNTITLPAESHQFTYTPSNNIRTAIFTNTNWHIYYQTTELQPMRILNQTYQGGNIYYKGIELTGNQRYRIRKMHPYRT